MKKLLVLIVVFCFAAFAAVIGGTWKASIRTANGIVENTFVFKVDGDKLLGTVRSGTMSALPISEGRVDGDTISFSVVQHSDGHDFKMKYAGKINGN